MYTHGSRKGYCQAQPKPKSKLEAEMAIFQLSLPPSHQPIHPPIRTSLDLASDNITAKSKVAYLSGKQLNPIIANLDHHQA